MPFAARWMDLKIIITKLAKDKHHRISLKCGILKKKKIQMNLFTKQK